MKKEEGFLDINPGMISDGLWDSPVGGGTSDISGDGCGSEGGGGGSTQSEFTGP